MTKSFGQKSVKLKISGQTNLSITTDALLRVQEG